MSFKSAREKAGITQADVARRFKLSRSSVNAWEKGETHPRGSRLLEVAQMLGCSVEEILRSD